MVGRQIGDALAPTIPAVILAGGRATRLGGADKSLLRIDDRPILDHILDGLRPQVGRIALSANGEPQRFAAWNLPVLADTVPDQPGPLAGILAGMWWAGPFAEHILSWPGDTPRPPDDLLRKLSEAAGPGGACAASNGRMHPVIGLWPTRLAETLAAGLQAGERRVAAFAASVGVQVVEWTGTTDPFTNINTPEDLRRAQVGRME